MKKINYNFETTTIVVDKEDLQCAFTGTIKRGIMGFYGSLHVGDGKIVCMADTQEDLIENLDTMCTLKIRGKLHDVSGRQEKIMETPYFFN